MPNVSLGRSLGSFQANVAFQPLCPLRTGTLVGQIQARAEFTPGGSGRPPVGQLSLDCSFEFAVGHFIAESRGSGVGPHCLVRPCRGSKEFPQIRSG